MVPLSIWILGYGKFGRRAADLMTDSSKTRPHITVIDIESPDHVPGGIDYIQADGALWFVDNFHRTSKIDRIIPAMPVHLAAEWVKGRLVAENRTVHQFPVPKEILPFLPNPYRINTNTYAISYATFHCPPDCNEPVEFCTVTGQSRPTPLYELVNRISLDDVVVLSLQSRQFAPGAGGFYPGDLWRLFDIVQKHLPADFLLCTGCKCHGIITGLSVMK